MKAFLFDMDGVLVDSEDLHKEAEQYVCRKYSIPFNDADWLTFRGLRAPDVFRCILQEKADQFDIKQLAREKIEYYCQNCVTRMKLYNNVLPVLTELKKDYKLALVTSSSERIQQSVFAIFGLSDYFSAVVHGDMITQGKPHPEPYLKAIQLLDVAPEDCYVVEDADNGVRAGKEAGARVIALTTTLPRARLLEADMIFADLSELLKLRQTT